MEFRRRDKAGFDDLEQIVPQELLPAGQRSSFWVSPKKGPVKDGHIVTERQGTRFKLGRCEKSCRGSLDVLSSYDEVHPGGELCGIGVSP